MRVGCCKSEQSKEDLKQPLQYPKALLTSGSCFHGTLYIFSFFSPSPTPNRSQPCRLAPFYSQSLLDSSPRQRPRGLFAVDESLSGSCSIRIIATTLPTSSPVVEHYYMGRNRHGPTVQLPRGAPSWPSLAPLSNRRTDLMEQGRSRVAEEEKTIIQEATGHMRISSQDTRKTRPEQESTCLLPDLTAPGARAPTQPRRVSSSGQTNKWRYDVRLTQRRQTNLSENT